MWVILKYIYFFIFLLLSLMLFTKDYIQFVLLSELCWVFFYTLTVFTNISSSSLVIYSLPFLVLLLTAIEASVIWSIFIYYYSKFK